MTNKTVRHSRSEGCQAQGCYCAPGWSLIHRAEDHSSGCCQHSTNTPQQSSYLFSINQHPESGSDHSVCTCAAGKPISSHCYTGTQGRCRRVACTQRGTPKTAAKCPHTTGHENSCTACSQTGRYMLSTEQDVQKRAQGCASPHSYPRVWAQNRTLGTLADQYTQPAPP